MRWLAAAVFLAGLLSSAAAESVTPTQPDPPGFFVLFDAGSTEISPAAQPVLDQVLVDYQVLRPAVVHVNGHYYDRSMAREEADCVSKQMAEAVRDYIASKGVPSDVIVLRWYVDNRPISLTDDKLAESLNRSVDVLFDGAKNVLRP